MLQLIPLGAKDVISYINAISSALCFPGGLAYSFFFSLKGKKKTKVQHNRGSPAPAHRAHKEKKKNTHIYKRLALYHITPLPNRSYHESSSAAIPTETKSGSEATQ